MTVRITRLCLLAELSPETSGAPDGNRFLHQQRQHHHTHTDWLWLWNGLHGASNCHLARLCGLTDNARPPLKCSPPRKELGQFGKVFKSSLVRQSWAHVPCVRESAWRSSSDQSSGEVISQTSAHLKYFFSILQSQINITVISDQHIPSCTVYYKCHTLNVETNKNTDLTWRRPQHCVFIMQQEHITFALAPNINKLSLFILFFIKVYLFRNMY